MQSSVAVAISSPVEQHDSTTPARWKDKKTQENKK